LKIHKPSGNPALVSHDVEGINNHNHNKNDAGCSGTHCLLNPEAKGSSCFDGKRSHPVVLPHLVALAAVAQVKLDGGKVAADRHVEAVRLKNKIKR
jgi:hypothetical protein